MLFEENKDGLGKEAIEKLKEKAKKIAENMRSIRNENEQLLKEIDLLKEEKEKLLRRLDFYESERSELTGLVKGLIEEFEQEQP